MSTVRVIFIIASLCLIAGFYYMAHNGIMGESRDLDRSVRLGGPSGISSGRAK